MMDHFEIHNLLTSYKDISEEIGLLKYLYSQPYPNPQISDDLSDLICQRIKIEKRFKEIVDKEFMHFLDGTRHLEVLTNNWFVAILKLGMDFKQLPESTVIPEYIGEVNDTKNP